MRFLTIFLTAICVSCAGWADTLTLRSGQVIRGTFLGGTARTIKMEVSDNIQTFDVTDIATLEFTAGAPPSASAGPPPQDAQNAPPPPPPQQDAPPAAAAPPPPPEQDASNVAPPPAQNTAGLGVDLPAGTNIVVRMIDGIDSEKSSVGQSFRASLDQPVMVNGQTIILRGADATVKLVDDKESGKLTGRTELTLSLQSVNVNGQMIDLNTQSVTRSSDSRGSRTAKLAGGGAALGAIIGAIAGGGKGAAIGAGAGAAAGTGAEVATKGQKVHVPSETRLTFVLDAPIHL